MVECDLNYLRFLWVKDISQQDSDLQVFRFTHVAFGLSSSPFLLNATVRHHLEKCRASNPDIICQLAEKGEPTKRNVISITGRFYDPLGFISPVIVYFKIISWQLCSNKITWDQLLPTELTLEWRTLVSRLQGGSKVLVPRAYTSHANHVIVSRYFCIFCDASTRAYAAVIHLVSATKSSAEVSFVASKTRVSLLQPLTIPRLELLSAHLVTMLMDSLRSTPQEVSLRCFTDSKVALYWIQGTDNDWKPFIRNRVTDPVRYDKSSPQSAEIIPQEGQTLLTFLKGYATQRVVYPYQQRGKRERHYTVRHPRREAAI